MALEARVNVRLGGYGRLSAPEQAKAARELTAPEDEGGLGMTQQQAAEVLGVKQGTISKRLSGKDYSQEYSSGDYSTLTSEDDPAGYSQEYLDEEPGFSPDPVPDGSIKLLPPRTSDENEWYTPRWLFDALGIKFAIDVCAPLDRTHSAVPADRHFTIEDDGLAQPWDGIAWCNPPYSTPEPWARRMIHHGDGLI